MIERYCRGEIIWVAVAVIVAATPCLGAQYIDLNNDGFTDIVEKAPGSVIVSLNDQNASFGRDDLGQSVASGIYFYRLTMGEQTKTRKMLLIK